MPPVINGQERRPKRGQTIATLAPGENVIVSLRGPASERINQYGGEVVAVDGTAIRLRVSWSRFGLTPMRAEGERVIAWQRIEHVRPEAAS